MQASPHGHVLLDVNASMQGSPWTWAGMLYQGASHWDPAGAPPSPGPGHQEVLTRERAEVRGCRPPCQGRQAAGLEARLQRP